MSDLPDYEKLGVFYLGRTKAADGAPASNLLYDAKDLTTHAMIVGMTGSGKTGLAVSLIEEAAIDGVPAILIDPKGDLANLLLQFPEMRPEDFRPWIDEDEARRKGLSPDELAVKTSETWRKGLAKWDEDGERIRRLGHAAEFAVYTPGDTAGRPLCVLRSFDAPKGLDSTALRDRILYTVSGLLGLLGISDDSVQGREHIFLSTLLEHEWRAGRDVTLEGIIRGVQDPPFSKVGVFDVETFYPAKDRMKLAMSLNALLASPGFSAWLEGEPLDAAHLLHGPDGRPRVSVLSIAHLSDSERMFFVTALLNEVLSWMRRQPGTGSLRAILYMDEIFGYFPPTANPPSKAVMLTLLKQARAFGLGIVLSTQNPVDLDYKGLSNCGTWFIGRLQTERDKMRILDGLASASDAASAGFDRAEADKLLSGLANRTFFLRNVHDDASVLFETRWAMSYLAGPLTLPQLRTLCAPPKADEQSGAAAGSFEVSGSKLQVVSCAPEDNPQLSTPNSQLASARPALPATLRQYRPAAIDADESPVWRPVALGIAKLHFASATAKVDLFEERSLVAEIEDDGSVIWEDASVEHGRMAVRVGAPAVGSGEFVPPPEGALTAKTDAAWRKSFATALYQTQALELWRYAPLKLLSNAGEEEGEFRARVAMADRERRDAEKTKLAEEFQKKAQALDDKIRTASARVEREKDMRKSQWFSTAVSAGATLLGALLGTRRSASSAGTITRAGSTLRRTASIGKKSGDVQRAEESLDVLQERRTALEKDYEERIEAIRPVLDPAEVELESVVIRPRKADIDVLALGVLWKP